MQWRAFIAVIVSSLNNYLKEETKQAYRTAENNGYVLIS